MLSFSHAMLPIDSWVSGRACGLEKNSAPTLHHSSELSFGDTRGTRVTSANSGKNWLVKQEQPHVAVGPGNAQFISIHQVSSDAATLSAWHAASPPLLQRCC